MQQARVEQLATGSFMEQAYNLILVGGTGTGKTHPATAIGIAATHPSKRIRFYNAVDLVNRLDKEKQQGKAGNPAKQPTAMDAVILDELGYLPFPASGGALLFHPISHLYEKTSLIITATLSFGEWVQVFGDAKRPRRSLIALLITAISWKPAMILIDLNNEKRRWKANNHTL